MNIIEVKIKKLHENAIIPSYANFGDAGVDLITIEDTIIRAGETKIIKTGLAMDIPVGYELQIRPKSGNSAKSKLRIANAPGTIDCQYRGEIGIIVDNIGSEDIEIKKGKGVAQGVFNEIPVAHFVEVEELSETDRGSGGYGSSNRGIV